MTAFSTIVNHGTSLEIIAASSPVPGGRFAGDPVRWIGVPVGTVLQAFATGAVAVSSGAHLGIPGDTASGWTLFELAPLPQMAPAAFKELAGGLPVQLVVVRGSGAAGPMTDDCLVGGSAFVTAPAGAGSTAFFAMAFQDRVCRDPLTWVQAIASSGSVDSNWAQFVTDLAALPGARTLYVLDHIGRPLNGGGVSVAIDGGAPANVDFTLTSDGNTGIVVPEGSRATITFRTASAPIVAAIGVDNGAFQSPLALGMGDRLAQVLDAATWLAQPAAGVTSMQRWNPNSHLEPIVDGNPYFARLVDDLRSAKSGGAVEFSGWVFIKGSQADSTIEWPLVPGADHAPNDTRLIPLVEELRGAGVNVKFLVNQFLRFESNSLDDFPELLGIVFAVYASLLPFDTLKVFVTDPAGFFVGIGLLIAAEILSTGLSLDLIKHFAELSRDTVGALHAIDANLAIWTPYPSAFADNPLVPQPFKIRGHTIDDFNHAGAYHQKFVNIRDASGSFISYLGGIDINSNRVDDPFHRAIYPFHDVQVRITGPAAKDVIQTFQQRAQYHGTSWPINPPDHIDPAGSHLVQIARTHFRPTAGSGTTPFPFAPNGESTTANTIKAAIEAARDFIYIEDQYLTPPDDYVHALIDAADSSRGVQALIITIPYQIDLLYGEIRRANVLSALSNAWGTRLSVGSPFRRFLHPTPALTTNLGRMRLTVMLKQGATQATLGPEAHLPEPPFWAFIGNELVLVTDKVGAPTSSETSPVRQQVVDIVRAGGVDPRWGAQPNAHPVNTPVLCVQIPSIFVHAKVMIVDDVFLFVGSSNINRRSLYHDGELDSFTIPQHLKGDSANPARVLRGRLWAEHLGLPAEMGISLFADPLSAIPYFQARSWYNGSHRQPLTFFGSTPPITALGTSDTIASEILKITIGELEETAKTEVWRSLIDPTTLLEPPPPGGRPRRDGPEYP